MISSGRVNMVEEEGGDGSLNQSRLSVYVEDSPSPYTVDI